MRVRWFVGISVAVAAAAAAVACGSAEPPVAVEAPPRGAVAKPKPAVTREPQKPVFDFPSGTFAVKATKKVTDHCGTMQWVSTEIEINPEKWTLYATPDDRLYSVEIDRGVLVARGVFEERPQCGNETYTEIWRLERQSRDELTGYVTTYSFFNSVDCLHACKAVFSVRVARE